VGLKPEYVHADAAAEPHASIEPAWD